jgi:hypothetical protein
MATYCLGFEVAEEEKDYSEFVKRLANVGYIISIFAGFTLTTLVLIITRFSDPSASLLCDGK